MTQEKLRIIHTYPIWLPQTQTWMFIQVKYLPKNVDVHIVCEVTENLDQFSLPNIHCLIEKSWIAQHLEKGLRHYSIRIGNGFLSSVIKEKKIQLVHSHFGNIGWINQKTIQKMGVKHVVTYYGYDVNMLPTQDKRWISRYQELFFKANLFLCEGPFMANELVKMGCPKEKIIVHHLGAETEKIQYMPRKWRPGEILRVLIAASFVEKKGIPYALQALAKLQELLPLEISIIGDVNPGIRDQSEKQKILAILNQTGLIKVTRLLGFQSHSRFFEEAYKHHIFISPSITASDGNTEGGAPVSLIELMATGMPIVSTNHCDIPEVVQYGIDDWLVEERDVTGLLKRMLWLCEFPEKWEQLLEKGRNRIETEFSAAKQGQKLEEIYKNLLGS